MEKSDVIKLVERSKLSNVKNDITGCLLIADNELFQVIEGEELSVKDLFNKIKLDPRHTRIQLMWSSTIDDRAFGKWTMIHKEITKEQLHLTGKATTGQELLDIIQLQIR